MLSILKSLFRGYDPIEVAVEIGLIWLGVWLIVRFLRNTRGAGVIKGFALVVAAVAIGVRLLVQLGGQAVGGDAFARIRFLADQLLILLVFALIVVFQPEIRQAMSRLGQTKLFRGSRQVTFNIAEEVAEAVEFLSRSRFGALIVIERYVPLGDFAGAGTELDAKVTAALLESIFWPSNPLHDLATVLRGDRVWCAGVQLPLAEEGSVPPHLGARHRAGLGVTLDTDCVVVIVSEETGGIRFAHRGTLSAAVPRDEVKNRLLTLLESPADETPAAAPDSPEGGPA